MFFRHFNSRKGQATTIEYAVLFFIVVAVVSAMATYLKRAAQARIRDTSHYAYGQVNELYRVYYPSKPLRYRYEPYYQHTNTIRGEEVYSYQREFDNAGGSYSFENDDSATKTTVTASNISSPKHAD